MTRALRCAASLCAALWLTACGPVRPPPVRTELIDVPVTVYVPLPAALTAPLPYPQPPAANCMDDAGRAAVCALDGLLWITEWRELVDKANADRAAASRLGREAAGAPRLNPGDQGDQP